MSFHRKHRLLGYVALALACMMIGSALTLAVNPTAQAENTVVITSPFTAAISQVRGSVVGVNNYETVRYNNYPNGFGNYFFGFGFGYGSPYGNGRGGNEEPTPQTQEKLAATGSGVVIAEHYVLTNYHVVEDSTRVDLSVYDYATDEISNVPAAVAAYDANLDLAVLYAPELTLAPVVMGNSDTLQVGDWAICIGNPLGESFFGTVTTGIVSALNRSVSSTSYDKYGRRETKSVQMIQVDAAINSGNSGGGMFSVTGELMGVPARKYGTGYYSSTDVDGIGMCIPINVAKPLIDEVLSGKVELPEVQPAAQQETAAAANDLTGKPRLGVTITNLNSSSTAVLTGQLPNGVYVSGVDENGPAATAGMQAGDIIVDVDDTVITTVTQLQEILSGHAEGDTLAIKVYRVPGLADLTTTEAIPDGEYIDLKVTLAVIDPIAQ